MHHACQTIYANNEKIFVGEWDPKVLVEIVNTAGYDWQDKRVLDIGANTGGFSLEIARLGASVVAAEPDPYGNNLSLSKHILADISRQENLDLTIVNNDFFSVHELQGDFDVIVCFGLLYHFRYFMYSLDYLSSLKPRVLFLSTQTHPGSDLALFNRANPGILREGHLQEDTILTGWHPTRPLLEKMLHWAGFINISSLTDKEYNFPSKMHGATNSSYYMAELATSKDPKTMLTEFYPR